MDATEVPETRAAVEADTEAAGPWLRIALGAALAAAEVETEAGEVQTEIGGLEEEEVVAAVVAKAGTGVVEAGIPEGEEVVVEAAGTGARGRPKVSVEAGMVLEVGTCVENSEVGSRSLHRFCPI